MSDPDNIMKPLKRTDLLDIDEFIMIDEPHNLSRHRGMELQLEGWKEEIARARAVKPDFYHQLVPAELTQDIEERGYVYRGPFSPRDESPTQIIWEKHVLDFRPSGVNYTVYLKARTRHQDDRIIDYVVEEQIQINGRLINKHGCTLGADQVLRQLEIAEARLREDAATRGR